CAKETKKLDDELLSEARYLATQFKVQVDWSQLQNRSLHVLGLLTSTTAPNGHLISPVWVAEGAGGWRAFEGFYRPLIKTGITLPEDDLSPKVHSQAAEFFQIDTVWGITYRSPSLLQKELAFPLDPAVFSHDSVLDWEFDDTHLDASLLVRRV